MQIGIQTGRPRLGLEPPWRERDVVGRSVDRGGGTGPVGEREPEPDRMP